MHRAWPLYPFTAFSACGLPYALWLWAKGAPCLELLADSFAYRQPGFPPGWAKRVEYREIGDVILFDHPEDTRDRLELHLGGGTRVRVYTCNLNVTAAEVCGALAARGVAAAANPTVR